MSTPAEEPRVDELGEREAERDRHERPEHIRVVEETFGPGRGGEREQVPPRERQKESEEREHRR